MEAEVVPAGGAGLGVSWVRVVMPIGVVTVIVVTAPSFWGVETEHSILYPGGRNVLKPWIRTG